MNNAHPRNIQTTTKNNYRKFTLLVYSVLVAATLVLYACGGGSGSGNSGPTRSFWMGTTPFFATPALFPDWQFENLDDKDLLSLHVDDFWGVPWVEFRDGTPRPAAWENKWTAFANASRATGKTLYLAVSPLGGRKTLAPSVNASGDTVANWAPVDADGCYPFATDGSAAGYKTAYINYLVYLINLVQPKYVSPAVEMNVPFSQCSAADKAAWIAWYTDVHNAIKAAFPTLVVFPTFQMEHLYGISDPQAACTTGTTLAACFDQRLAEALTIPGDRIAFSSYPLLWKYLPDYSFSYPTDTYARVKSATTRKIWIAETGWAAVEVLQSYPHGSGICGSDLFPATIANNTEQEGSLRWLLAEAQSQKFETVIWWLNRDYLDGAVAATCPCNPASDTCQLVDNFYATGGAPGETLLRLFGNMALRNHDSSPRPAHIAWREYFDRTLYVAP